MIEYANRNKLQQDHPCVVKLIRQHYLQKPALRDLNYNLNNPDPMFDPSDGQSKAILRILRNQVNIFSKKITILLNTKLSKNYMYRPSIQQTIRDTPNVLRVLLWRKVLIVTS
jgi:hypothetical protein